MELPGSINFPGLGTVRVGEYSEKADSGLDGTARELLVFLNERYRNSPYEMKVLELGVGPGSMMEKVGPLFGEKVIGMNIQEKFVRDEKIRNHLLAGESLSLPISNNTIDVIFSKHLFDNSLDLEEILKEAERVLSFGGEITLIVPRPQQNPEQLVALVDVLKVFNGVEKLVETWSEPRGGKTEAIRNRLKPAKVKEGEVVRKIEIVDAKTISVPGEIDFAWVITLKKRK